MHSCIICRPNLDPNLNGKLEVHVHNTHPYFYDVTERLQVISDLISPLTHAGHLGMRLQMHTEVSTSYLLVRCT